MLIGVENVSVVAVDEIGNRGDDALLVGARDEENGGGLHEILCREHLGRDLLAPPPPTVEQSALPTLSEPKTVASATSSGFSEFPWPRLRRTHPLIPRQDVFRSRTYRGSQLVFYIAPNPAVDAW